MKDKVNQMFKDKLFLVMMVIGLLTAVAAVGVLTVSNTDEKGQSPYLEVPGGEIIAQDSVPETAQKEEKAEEKISEIEASKVPQENYAQKEEIQTPRMILQQKQVQENRQPKPWY